MWFRSDRFKKNEGNGTATICQYLHDTVFIVSASNKNYSLSICSDKNRAGCLIYYERRYFLVTSVVDPNNWSRPNVITRTRIRIQTLYFTESCHQKVIENHQHWCNKTCCFVYTIFVNVCLISLKIYFKVYIFKFFKEYFRNLCS